jgi:hypothetical protein
MNLTFRLLSAHFCSLSAHFLLTFCSLFGYIVAMLGIDYNKDEIDYVWSLSPPEIEKSKGTNLSSWAGRLNGSLCIYYCN